MTEAGFVRDPRQSGIWHGRGNVQVDLLVPETVGGAGRRGARLGVHGNQVARKARGLEGALVDRAYVFLTALEEGDRRRFETMVAGPAALFVAKVHKVAERRESPGRLADKDALDAFRLLRAVPTATLVASIRRVLADSRSEAVRTGAIDYCSELFGTAEAQGCQMAARAVVPLENPVEIAASCAALAGDLLRSL